MSKRIALIDADLLSYELGSNERQGFEVSWDYMSKKLDQRIEEIRIAAECDEVKLFLTNGSTNFRLKLATIQPYKGNRSSPKPPYYEQARKHMLEKHKAFMCDGFEADDKLAMLQYADISEASMRASDYSEGIDDGSIPESYSEETEPKYWMNTVICSRDKDLKMVPGWHYSWGSGKQKEQPLHFVTEIEGTRFFYQQLLTGDSTDNIPGLHGCGKVKATNALKDCETELEMMRVVKGQYKKYFGTYWKMFLEENGQLLWMQQHEGQMWKIPFTDAEINDIEGEF